MQDRFPCHQPANRCGARQGALWECGHLFDALSRLSEIPQKNSAPFVPDAAPAKTPQLVGDTAPKAKLDTAFQRKSVQWPFALLALLLLLLAVFQAIYYLRTPIASRWPQLRPPLEAACTLLHCKVALPHQSELLTIDDSDLQEDAEHEDLIHLSATLINNAPFTQAYPLLELTLTDRYDKAVIRRAFNATEYLPGADTSQGLAPGEEIRVRLPLTVNDEAVAGYRLFVTYPSSNENH